MSSPNRRASACTGPIASPTDAALRPIIERAGAELLHRFGREQAIRKPDGSPVTAADRAAERLIVTGLQAAFPHDAIEGEEGTNIPGGPARWTIDPLDGTSAYLERLAHWGPAVARIDGDAVVCGATYLPRIGEYYFAEAGVGAFRNGVALVPLDDPPIDRNSVLLIPSRFHAHADTSWPGKARCLGSIAAHLALVASGTAVAAIVPRGWHLWDTASGFALIEEVGGLIATQRGQPLDLKTALSQGVGPSFIVGTAGAIDWLQAPGHLVRRSNPTPRGHDG